MYEKFAALLSKNDVTAYQVSKKQVYLLLH